MQAQTLARTSVLVTPCGSLAALAYLLPPGSTAVVMNFYQAATGANVQLDDAAFWNVDHVTLVYYPVGPEDYEGTTVSLTSSHDCVAACVQTRDYHLPKSWHNGHQCPNDNWARLVCLHVHHCKLSMEQCPR